MRATFQLILAICVFSSAAHALFPIEGLPPPDPERSKIGNACALGATAVANNAEGLFPEYQEYLRLCSTDPDGFDCDGARRRILESGKQVPARTQV